MRIALSVSLFVAALLATPSRAGSGDFDPGQLRNGDLIFQTSRSAQSVPIQLATRSPWSHCGIVYVKRLQSADSLLTAENLAKMKAAGKAYDGKPYDSFFGWADDRIYCSELIYKIYRDALGVEIGVTRKLRDFDLSAPIVARTLKQRYGEAVPMDEIVIAPSDMHADPRLVKVYSNF